jgi:ADP-ribose pyrophosphatase YjhB (NUDIX family)
MNNGALMHHIQKSIILSLARKSPLRFSQLQPPRIPNNTFSYHLKKLIDCGYVESTDAGYVASRKALKLVAFGVGNKAFSMIETISMIYVVNSEDEVLLVSRFNKPFQGWYGMPSGKIHLDETLEQAAIRELFEKTMIVPSSKLDNIGVLDFRYMDRETQDIFSHVIAFIYMYKFTGDREELNDKVTRYGQLSWSRLGRSNILPEVYAVKKMVDKGKFTCVSESFEEPAQLPVFSADLLSEVEAEDLITT